MLILKAILAGLAINLAYTVNGSNIIGTLIVAPLLLSLAFNTR